MTALSTLLQEVEQAFRPVRSTGVRIKEEEQSYKLEALVAGVKSKDISIALENGSLHIDAKSESYSYTYMIPVAPDQVNTGAIKATVEDGILRLTLPKAEIAKPRRIEVKTIS